MLPVDRSCGDGTTTSITRSTIPPAPPCASPSICANETRGRTSGHDAGSGDNAAPAVPGPGVLVRSVYGVMVGGDPTACRMAARRSVRSRAVDPRRDQGTVMALALALARAAPGRT